MIPLFFPDNILWFLLNSLLSSRFKRLVLFILAYPLVRDENGRSGCTENSCQSIELSGDLDY